MGTKRRKFLQPSSTDKEELELTEPETETKEMKREASNQPIWSLLFRDKGQPFFRDIKASNYSPALFGHGTTGWDASSNLRKSAVNHGHQPPM